MRIYIRYHAVEYVTFSDTLYWDIAAEEEPLYMPGGVEVVWIYL